MIISKLAYLLLLFFCCLPESFLLLTSCRDILGSEACSKWLRLSPYEVGGIPFFDPLAYPWFPEVSMIS